jgi:hypothetical protein
MISRNEVKVLWRVGINLKHGQLLCLSKVKIEI